MKTMTHTDAQREEWHLGRKHGRSFYRCLATGKYGGANTPPSAKKGIYYTPLRDPKKTRRAR